ncbi:MAG: InlB B-repeat-containing protein [Candidatus Bathyarchaeota archaeon]|nr:InlB B-repeat-containing protein [Candidatus Termiticorpusculum sp.]
MNNWNINTTTKVNRLTQARTYNKNLFSLKTFKRMFSLKMVLTITLILFLSLAPLAVHTSGTDVGSIPIPDQFKKTYVESQTSAPVLQPGQVWTDKNVAYDDDNDAFIITLLIKLCEYDGLSPLAEGSTVIFTYTLDSQFSVESPLPSGLSQVGNDIIWEISENQINGNEHVSFTLQLNSGWELDTFYYADDGVTATFTPAAGNGYYWVEQDIEEEAFLVPEFNWNAGNGFKYIKIIDPIGFSFILPQGSSASINGKDYQWVGMNKSPDDCNDYTWGCLWTKGQSTYQFWIKPGANSGFGDDVEVLTYEVHVTSGGGHAPIVGGKTYQYTTTSKSVAFNWDGNNVVTDLSNNSNNCYILITEGEAKTFAVSYNGNGNTDGTVPVDANCYLSGGSVIVLTKGNMVRAGYDFVNWNTQKDGAGAPYVPGDTFTMSDEDVTLYAQWTVIPYSITYVLKGGDNAKDNPTSYTVEDAFPISIADPSRPGYDFLGWTVTYFDGSQPSVVDPVTLYGIPVGTTGNVELTAYWSGVEDEVTCYALIYDGNGHTRGTAPIDGHSPYDSGDQVIVLGQGDLSKDNYDFLGWALSSNADKVAYTVGSTFNIMDDTVLYAVWIQVDTNLYTVTYQPGTHGTFTAINFSDLSYGDPTPNTPTVTGDAGWKFTGWLPIPSETVTGNADYVAQWEQEQRTLFTVRFVDWDGVLLKSESVSYGGDATAPANPTRADYIFTGWDRTFTNVTADLTVTAQYRLTNSTDDAASDNSTDDAASDNSTDDAASDNSTDDTTSDDSMREFSPSNSGDTDDETSKVSEWAVVNLILSIAGVILAAIITIHALLLRKTKAETDEQNQYGAKHNKQYHNKKYAQHRTMWLIAAITLGIIGIVVFLLTENTSLPMGIVDKWTIANAVILAVEIICVLFVFKLHKDETNQKQSVSSTPTSKTYHK